MTCASPSSARATRVPIRTRAGPPVSDRSRELRRGGQRRRSRHARADAARVASARHALLRLGTSGHAGAFGSDTIEALRDIVCLLLQHDPFVVVPIAQIKLGYFEGAVSNARIGHLADRESTARSPVIAVGQ